MMLKFILLFSLVITTVYSQIHTAVPIDAVSTLLLRQGEYSTGRRNSPVPQLQCVGGDAKYESHQLRSLTCKQIGYDGIDAIWSCTADMLNPQLRLGQVDINCEGFDYPDDHNILAGSCGAQYFLHYNNHHIHSYNNKSIIPIVEMIFILFFLIIAIFVSFAINSVAPVGAFFFTIFWFGMLIWQ